jgi:hypothetical protein
MGLPDAEVVHNRRTDTLHRVVAAPGWHLLLCGPPDAWPARASTGLGEQHGGLVTAHHLAALDGRDGPYDPTGQALHRLGLTSQRAAP